VCGWQVILCDSLVTPGPYLSALAVMLSIIRRYTNHQITRTLTTDTIHYSFSLPLQTQNSSFSQIIFLHSSQMSVTCCTAACLFTYCCLLLPIICVALFYRQFFIFLVSHFQSHQCQPTTVSFQSPTFGGTQHYLQPDVKVLHFTR